tara:strand:- start:189 stop:626 length:438 start_codon:yes stop_codon:yes gene_type:complete
MTLVVRNRNLNGGYDPHIDIGSVFEEILRFDPFAKRSHSSRDDRVSIRDLEDRHEISIAAPGLKKADFNIQLKADRLSISYDASVDEDENSQVRMFSKSAFYKAYNVSEGTVPEDIKAKYSAGILKVTVNRPKVEVPTEHNIKIN